MERDLLKYICVKVSIVIDGNTKLFGSGAMFRHNGKTYVITAEHCIHGVNTERYENTTTENIQIQHRLNDQGEFTEIEPFEIVFFDKTSDTALLEVNYEGQIPFDIHFATELYSNNLFLRGYPRWLKGDEAATHQGILKEEQVSSFILFSSDFVDTTRLKDTEEFTKNLSGSGVFIKEKGKITLVGIVSELREEEGILGQVKCSKLSSIFQEIEVFFNNNPLLLALKRQNDRQLEKQINSTKYIRNTFIETRELKDNLRYFCAPFDFIDKTISEYQRIDLKHFNRKQELAGREPIENNINSILKDVSTLDFRTFGQYINELTEYTKSQIKEFEKTPTNDASYAKRKFENKLNEFKYYSKRVLLIQDNAGQGKTNIVCDLVDKVISRRSIPCVFSTGQGYELNAEEIKQSLSRQIYPNDNVDFNDILKEIAPYCELNHSPFIIIIDGLNENSNPLFNRKLEEFISAVLEFHNIKVILTCRTEYFAHTFKNLLSASFKEEIITITDLKGQFNENQNEILFNAYLDHFKVEIAEVSDEVFKQLTNNFLMLRIFSEAHEGEQLQNVKDIYKQKLFQHYFKNKIENITENNNEIEREIFVLFERLISYMIVKQEFTDIPIDKVLTPEINKGVIDKFVYENVLIRKDISENPGSFFGKSEVLNFTFDEFRDYLIFEFLIDNIYKSHPEKVKYFIENILTEKSPIFEGFSTYLFIAIRKNKSEELLEIIKSKEWYPTVFLRCVLYNIPDNEIENQDLEFIMNLFKTQKHYRNQIMDELIYKRYNPKEYRNLNICLLLDVYSKTSMPELEEQLYKFFEPTDYSGNSVLDEFADWLIDIINKEIESVSLDYEYLFDILFFLIPFSEGCPFDRHGKIEEAYLGYWLKTKNLNQLKRIKNSDNKIIVKLVNSFVECVNNSYEKDIRL